MIRSSLNICVLCVTSVSVTDNFWEIRVVAQKSTSWPKSGYLATGWRIQDASQKVRKWKSRMKSMEINPEALSSPKLGKPGLEPKVVSHVKPRAQSSLPGREVWRPKWQPREKKVFLPRPHLSKKREAKVSAVAASASFILFWKSKE